MMSYDKSSPNAKIGRSNSNDPEFLEQLVREGLFRPAGTKVLLQTMLQGCGGIR